MGIGSMRKGFPGMRTNSPSLLWCSPPRRGLAARTPHAAAAAEPKQRAAFGEASEWWSATNVANRKTPGRGIPALVSGLQTAYRLPD
jgi:hypothetical protein